MRVDFGGFTIALIELEVLRRTNECRQEFATPLERAEIER